MQTLIKWALLLILFLPICFLCFRQKKWYLCLLFAFVGFLPEQLGVRLHDKLPLVSAIRILLLIVIAFWFFRKKKERKLTVPISLFVYLCINLIISLINLQHGFGELNRIFLFVFERALLVIAVSDLIEDKDELYRCVDFMILGCTAVAIIAIVQTVWNFDIASVLHLTKTTASVKITDRMELTRAYGTFNAISFGCYCAFMLPLIYLRLENTRKLIYSAAFALTLMALICSLTRSAWLCAFGALFILALVRRKRFFISMLPAVAMTVVLCIGLCFAQPKLSLAFTETAKTTYNAVLSVLPDSISSSLKNSHNSTTEGHSSSTSETTPSTSVETDPETTQNQETSATSPSDPNQETTPSTIRITRQPVSVSVQGNEEAKVSFDAEGEDLTYQWYYKNKNADAFVPSTAFSGPSYSVTMTAARDGRELYCLVTDKFGNTTQTDTVTITYAETKLQILEQPVSVTATANEIVRVSVYAIGNDLTYQWYYAEKEQDSFTLTQSFTSDYYQIPMTESRSGRRVYCVITDRNGVSVQTNTVTLLAKPNSTPNFGKNANNAVNSRTVQWTAVEYMSEEGLLIFGYGYNSYFNGKLHYRITANNKTSWQKAHAIDVGLVSLFTESGLVGFLTLIAFLCYMWIVAWKRRRQEKAFDLYALTLIMLPLYLLLNYVSSFLSKPVIWLFFALFYTLHKLDGFPHEKCIRLPKQKDC